MSGIVSAGTFSLDGKGRMRVFVLSICHLAARDRLACLTYDK